MPKLTESVKKAVRFFWKVSISLKFAIVVMIGLTLAMIVATVIESVHDTPSALYWVYHTRYFYALLGMLGWLIFAVAMSRLPWKKRHLPFLCAHLGILLLLYGSWLTFQFGIDGSMEIQEGTSESSVQILSEPLLVISEEKQVKTVPVPWLPPKARFRGINVPEYGLKVSEYISRAESQVGFVASSDAVDLAAPAIRVLVKGGPSAPPFMRMGQDAWVWGGDRNWMRQQIGPAVLAMAPGPDPIEFVGEGPELNFRLNVERSRLEYSIRGSDGKKKEGFLAYSKPEDLVGKVIETGWRFEATATILEWIPRAVSDVKYVPSRIQYGQGAPNSAILLESESGSKIWLGLGERATLDVPFTDGSVKRVSLAYFPRRVILPFAVRLERFQIDRYQGTMSPMEFSSLVSVDDPKVPDAPKNLLISMNEPMKHGGFTFYQASYVDAQPRPTISIFSVNQDPGRWLKYLGSLLIVCGSIWLFAMKYVKQRSSP